MEIKQLLEKLVARQDLCHAEIEFAIDSMVQVASAEQEDADAVEATTSQIQMGILLALLAAKGETAQEIAAFAKCMGKHSIAVEIPNNVTTLDIVGTGGDGANTVNLSTAAAILASACGAVVAKHGNRSVSSRSGSADVLEALGIPMLHPDRIAPCVRKAQIAFMYAPHFHPAMRFVKPIRQAMRIRCVFNILGPLLNPAHCKRVVIGVYTPKLLDTFGEALLALGIDHGLVVHCAGLDELNFIGSAEIVEVCAAENPPVKHYRFDASDRLGIPATELSDLRGGDADENAEILKQVFQGGTNCDNAIGNTIALNAGAGLYVYGKASSLEEGFWIAKKALREGKAMEKLEQWQQAVQPQPST